MFKKKYKEFNNLPHKSKLDQVLWFIENYLPHQKYRSVKKKYILIILRSDYKEIL